MSAPDVVVVGHVTLDGFGDRVRPGGSAYYAAVTAHRLGASVAILTSHGEDFPLEAIPPRVEVVSVPAASTTTFTHHSDGGRRRLRAGEPAAAPLSPVHVPDDWREAPLVLLAPVLGEVDPALATAFRDATIAVEAQGWLRRRARDGAVEPTRWEHASLVLPAAQAVFLSEEDARPVMADVNEWFQRVPVGVLTAGRRGALLFVNGERYEVRPHPARETDATGAGDVFATTFLLRYDRDGDPWEAAAAAACAAALSVTADGAAAVPDGRQLDDALADYHRAAA